MNLKPRVKIESVSSEFGRHLSPQFNSRILFSGQFGIGKTTFLKDFFEDKVKDYNTIWLSPVKYSVGSNEDVFEYIKFDIILQLLENYLVTSEPKQEISESLFVWSYLNNNPSKVLEAFFATIIEFKPRGEPALKILKIFKETHSNYKQYKKKILEKDKSEVELFQEYLASSIQKIGSIFEDDLITQSIRTYLEVLKDEGEDEGKKNVLVIDDFDRLDPEHIFRIFNILSVHNDYLSSTYENKFGFDKIIIVCDIDSIENYYHHKYGEKANFTGYIDKFCSSKFFQFSNDEAVRHFCEQNIKINGLPEHCEKALLLIILKLLEEQKITLRALLKYHYEIKQVTFTIPKSFITDIIGNVSKQYVSSFIQFKENKIEVFISSKNFPAIHILEVLTNILGGADKLKEFFYELSTKSDNNCIPVEYVSPIINSFFLLSHLAKNHNTLDELCFSQGDNVSMYNHDHHYYMKPPKAIFCKSDISIKLKWTPENEYQGNSGYFDEHTFDYLDKRIFENPKWQTDEFLDKHTTGLRSYQNLFTELTQIMEYLIEYKRF